MGLVILWIVLYWMWEPRSQREPVVTFPEPPLTIEQGSDGGEGTSAGVPTQPDPADPELAHRPEQSGGEGLPGSPFGDPPFREIVARKDDTFQKIAERELGSATLWTAIARANPFKDPNRLKPGDRVRVPMDAANPQGRPEQNDQRQAPQPPPVVEYAVQSGDTLSGIAKQFYGSVKYVDFLYEANRDRLRNKDDLRLGQVLKIPPKPDGG